MKLFLHMDTVKIKLLYGNVMEWKEYQHLLDILAGIDIINNLEYYI